METNEMDAYSRLVNITRKQPIDEGVWLPGFGYIMKLFLLIPDNGTYLNIRIGIYIFTLLSAFIIYRVIKSLTSNHYYSLFGMTMFLFHPLTIQLSVLTLTEPLWIFFILLSIYYLFFSDRKNRLSLSLVFYIISQTIRFESWLLIPVIAIFSLNALRHKKISVFQFILIFVFPIFWFFVTFLDVGYLFSFVLKKYHCSTNEPSPLHWNITNIIYDLKIQLSTYVFSKLGIFIVLLIGIFQKNKKISIISFSSLYLLIVFVIETYTSFNENTTPRFFYYLVPIITIVFPYLVSIFAKKNIKKPFLKIIFTLSLCLIIFLEYFTLNNNYYSEFTREAREIKNIINELQISKNNIVIFCAPYFDFSTLFSYETDYKIFPCSKDYYLDPNYHGVLIGDVDTSDIYDQERRWTNKISYRNLIFYRF
ncbi:MAG TPA: hypothetical protein VN174_00870 [Candidatus Methanoperedens sp.]|nr:hypothetical protein [Candidatus Methanoperedens sp.]